MSQAIQTYTKQEIQTLQKQGDHMTACVQAVLGAKFRHRNEDGSLFRPRIASSATYAPWYHVITLDASALWHFSTEMLTSAAVLDALAGTVRRNVRTITQVPGVGRGIAYVITLADIPPVAATKLPARVDFTLPPAGNPGLLIPFGVGPRGEEWKSLPDLGHALLTGEQGSGKSIMLHAVIASLTQADTNKLQLVLIDPKHNEFTAWGASRNLIAPIAHTEDEATAILEMLVDEIDRRGILMSEIYARKIEDYNKRAENPLPYILCIVDECLDLVSMAGTRSELAQRLKTLAVRGRSAGVYLWAATQHASAIDGMPRVVNVNLTTRICFRVLDADAARAGKCPGAEKISKATRGRMLVKLDSDIEAYQAPFLDDAALLDIAQPARHTAPTAPKSTFSDAERALIEWAISENGGYLSVKNIQVQTGCSKREAEALASKWERKGWLVKDKTAGNKRRLTEAAMELVDYQSSRGVSP